MPSCNSPTCDCNRPWKNKRHRSPESRNTESYVKGQIKTIRQLLRTGFRDGFTLIREGNTWFLYTLDLAYKMPIIIGHGHISFKHYGDRVTLSNRACVNWERIIRDNNMLFRNSSIREVMTS